MQGTKGLLRRLEQRTVTFELVSKWPMMNILMIYIYEDIMRPILTESINWAVDWERFVCLPLSMTFVASVFIPRVGQPTHKFLKHPICASLKLSLPIDFKKHSSQRSRDNAICRKRLNVSYHEEFVENPGFGFARVIMDSPANSKSPSWLTRWAYKC